MEEEKTCLFFTLLKVFYFLHYDCAMKLGKVKFLMIAMQLSSLRDGLYFVWCAIVLHSHCCKELAYCFDVNLNDFSFVSDSYPRTECRTNSVNILFLLVHCSPSGLDYDVSDWIISVTATLSRWLLSLIPSCVSCTRICILEKEAKLWRASWYYWQDLFMSRLTEV